MCRLVVGVHDNRAGKALGRAGYVGAPEMVPAVVGT